METQRNLTNLRSAMEGLTREQREMFCAVILGALSTMVDEKDWVRAIYTAASSVVVEPDAGKRSDRAERVMKMTPKRTIPLPQCSTNR